MSNDGLISRIYSNFRGVDFRGDEINLMRSPDSLNVWKDYKDTESIKTRPGMEKVIDYDDAVYGIYFYKANDTEMMIVHSGTTLYKVVDGVSTILYENVKATKSDAFIYNNNWFFKDGANYLQYDGTNKKDDKGNELKDEEGNPIPNINEVKGYVPTTSIGRKAGPLPGGQIYEDVNLLSDWRINTFIGDKENTEFYLDTRDLTPLNPEKPEEAIEFMENLTLNGVSIYRIFETDEEGNYITDDAGNKIQKYHVERDYENGKIVIKPAPPAPLTDGQDNISIKFKKTIDDRSKITNCTLLQVFDNRVFFSGNPDYPNVVWHCSLNDPTYCSDLDYYNEGLDTANVRGMVAGNNALWVFKEPSQANTSIFYHTPTIDADYGKIYPNTHSSIATGCVGKAINFNDDIVFFSDRGMEGISGDITSEQVVSHRSSLVDRKLLAEEGYKDMVLAEWEGYLMVFILHKLDETYPNPSIPGMSFPDINIPVIGTSVYLADSRALVPNENHTEYEWFYWELDHAITCATVNNGILYLGADHGVFTLTDTTCNVESYWVTPKDKFKYPQYLKTTNKRGCVVEATCPEECSISVYAKTNKTEEFEKIGTYEHITDAFVCRIKRKKWKDIQLKFYSKTRFSLETATLEAFVGGYIKR
jgi:hypothetical protein